MKLIYIIGSLCCIVLELFMKSKHTVDITRDEAYRSMPARDKQLWESRVFGININVLSIFSRMDFNARLVS